MKITIALLVLFGWIANIYQTVGMVLEPITGLFILKCVGIPFGPLGIVLGYIGLF